MDSLEYKAWALEVSVKSVMKILLGKEWKDEYLRVFRLLQRSEYPRVEQLRSYSVRCANFEEREIEPLRLLSKNPAITMINMQKRNHIRNKGILPLSVKEIKSGEYIDSIERARRFKEKHENRRT